MEELFDPVMLADAQVVALVPRMGFVLDDISRVADEELLERMLTPEAGVVLWALRDARNGPKIKASIFSWGPELDRTSEEALSAIFTYILSVSEHLSAEDLRSAVRSVAPQAEDVVMTAAEQLIEKGRARGRAEVLVRQLTLRFGPLPPGTKERVLSASDAELDRWSELVLTAKSIVEVLDG